MPRRRRHPVYDPLAPLGPKAQKRQAYALLAPLIAQINAEFDRRASSGGNSIRSYTDRLAQDLAPLASQTHATYAAAEAQQRADDAALANRLSGAGSTLAGQVAATPGVDSGTGDIAGIGAGAANAGAAVGSSRLAALLAHGAAAEAYSGQLPGFARLAGAQRLSNLTGQLESQRGSQLSEARAKIPALAQQIRDTELQKAIAVQSGLVDEAKMMQQQSQFNARQTQQQQHFDTQTQLALDRINLSQGQLDIARKREHRLSLGKKGKTGGFTPLQINNFRADAIDIATNFKHGAPEVLDSKGNVRYSKVDPHPGNQGARKLFRYLALRYPPSIADWAVGQLYGKWKVPGESGHRGPGGTGPR